MNTTTTTTKTCVLCDTEFAGFGNHPGPLATEGLCCSECYFDDAISARYSESYDESDHKQHRQSVVGEIRAIGKQMNDTIDKSGIGYRWWMLAVEPGAIQQPVRL